MKCINFIFTQSVMWIVLLFVWYSPLKVQAMNTGFSTEEKSVSEQQELMRNISISLIEEEPKKQPIDCFDVNENGYIALGFSNLEHKTICVYTSDGIFQYGYKFDCTGDFGIGWDTKGVIIYFVRGSTAIVVNSSGNIEDIKTVVDSIENNSYWNNTVFATSRLVKNCKYTIKNDMGILNFFASSYSQLVVSDNDNVNIVYDVTSKHIVKIITTIIAVLIFVTVVAVLIIKRIKTIQSGTQGASQRDTADSSVIDG
ncbi:MAG: hypothetical protein IJY56_00255 [Clostridia bacterium]|nr:hypothetical protein [Clostridia bacterium]